jgi:hypothetical protein
MNPDSPLVRNFKTKEIAVRDFIFNQFPRLNWIHDKIVVDGHSRRRPDLTLDIGSHVIFVEIEENGHDFGYNCGTKRLCELWEDVGQRPTVFIRFNPDSYIDEKDKKVPSCWKKNAQGLSLIRDDTAWTDRLRKLQDVVIFHLEHVPEKCIQIQELFFDCARPETEEYKVECPARL